MQKTAEAMLHNYSRVKTAGIYSEELSMLNPLNWVAGIPAALAGYASGPYQTKQELERTDPDVWKNILIPGLGPYRAARRERSHVQSSEKMLNRHLENEERTEELMKQMQALQGQLAQRHGVPGSA
jgi:hypothetical protein